MKVYLAGRLRRAERLKDLRTLLEREGFTVTSRWLDRHGNNDREAAEKDLADIGQADALVLMTEEGVVRGRGGRLVEFGIAVGQGKPVVLWGGEETLFGKLVFVRTAGTEQEVLSELRKLERRSRRRGRS